MVVRPPSPRLKAGRKGNEMKTEEQILARLVELNSRLDVARRHTKQAQTGSDQATALQIQARLEGNIGALEWILRADK